MSLLLSSADFGMQGACDHICLLDTMSNSGSLCNPDHLGFSLIEEVWTFRKLALLENKKSYMI